MGYRTHSLAQTYTNIGITSSTPVAYTSGDLIANSSVTASVTPLVFAIGPNYTLNTITVTSNTSVNTNAKFRVHLYGSSPTVSNADNGVWLTTSSNYIDSVVVDCSVNAFSAGISGTGIYTGVSLGSSIPMPLPINYTTVYALVAANAAWQASSTTSLTVTLNGGVDW